ncbi:acyl-CoA-binding domain-containing protein 6 isoform X2 [Haemorhous mexicanus]|uniref:acyl-CoA-binding domain-containing protein 6 isoform X2 n=1 Tax=Haemorhous mexicanus TaxID=30427 RepID=UPI0028BEA07E|nr:acyl-CoA-binding domain-containing protein 6 isoform X2 [Haemorhous mexicanus]
MASPPLSAAGGSGGELSSGSEAAATGAALPDRDLPALFEQAAERLPSLLPAASKEQLLYLYARYKQVKLGTCNTPKPGFFDFEGKQKWEAWKALGDTSPHQAMQEYIAAVKKLDPSWNPQTPEKRGKESKTVFGGPVISSLYQEEEIIREEDKNIFDYCRENNIDYVTKAIQSKKVDVNVTDEEGGNTGIARNPKTKQSKTVNWLHPFLGRALLHWACDRGHKELVSVLLQNAADVNIQDGEGQTALHYAATCEFLDIVELLLQAGADPGLRDQEGCLPEEVTDSKAITRALQQHGPGQP